MKNISFILSLLLGTSFACKAQEMTMTLLNSYVFDSIQHNQCVLDSFCFENRFASKSYLSKNERKKLMSNIVGFYSDTVSRERMGKDISYSFRSEMMLPVQDRKNVINSEGKFFYLDTPWGKEEAYHNESSYLIGDSICAEQLNSYPRFDESGDQVFDDNGNPEYFDTVTVKKLNIHSAYSTLKTIEKWHVSKSGFKKSNVAFTLNAMETAADYLSELTFSKNYLSDITSKKSKYSKEKPLIHGIAYDYLFYPICAADGYSFDWNILDDPFLQKCNMSSEYFTALNFREVRTFLQHIFTHINNGNFKVLNGKSEELAAKSFLESFGEKELVAIFDDEGYQMFNSDGEPIYETYISRYSIADIMGLHFEEDWYLAKNQFDIVKKVRSISFVVQNWNDFGQYEGLKNTPFKVVFD